MNTKISQNSQENTYAGVSNIPPLVREILQFKKSCILTGQEIFGPQLKKQHSRFGKKIKRPLVQAKK